MRMDSDDISRANRIETILSFLEYNPEVDVLGCQILETDFKGFKTGKIRDIPLSKDQIYSFSRLRSPINHVSAVMKRSAYIEVGGYEDVKYFEDYFLWLKFIHGNYNIINLPDVLVDVRVDGFSARRQGLRYARYEVAFVKTAFHRKYFRLKDAIIFILIRVPTRFMPKVLFMNIVNIFRK